MSDVSIESIATVGAVSAFLFAAATGITSRRGIQLIVVGMLFWWLPTISRAAGTWIAGQKGSHERSGAQRVGRTYCSPEMDWGCIGRADRASVASGGPRSARVDDACCR